MIDRVAQELFRRKFRDQSIALLAVGVAFLMPPIGMIAIIHAPIMGLPFPLVYVFSIWALLILATAFLSQRLQQSENATQSPVPPDIDH